MNDTSKFPDPTYRDTVLAPLFEGAKTHFVGPIRAINQAHLVMLVDTGILKAKEAKDISTALSAIDRDVDVPALTYTGEHEDYFFLVESELKARLGPDLGGMLHTARSRNDMDHTVFKMGLRQKTDDLLEQALALAEALTQTATRERDTLIVAYTHGQPAQPSTFGHYLAAVIEVLLRDIERLQNARDLLDHCPMGAAAITTSGFAIDRHQMAQLLGFQAPLQNSYSCIAAVDYVTGLYSAIKLLMLHLGRVVQDLQFWTAFEVGQLYVPNALVQVSSIMPQKRNPVPIEHLRHLASATVGRCDMVVNTMHNTPFTDMNDSEGEMQVAGYAAFASAARVLSLLTALIPACSIRADRVAATMDAACVTITELADTLVRRENVSFRQAHNVAAVTAQTVIAAGQSLADGFEAFRDAFLDELGHAPGLTAHEFATAVSAENFVAVRDRFGGPAPGPMDIALQGYRDEIAAQNLKTTTRKNRISQAEKTRETAFTRLMED